VTVLYVYGIVDGDHPIDGSITGVGRDEPPVQLVPLDGVSAVVSELDADAELDHSDLLRHKKVVDDVFEAGMVLPFRFGTILPDEAALIEEMGPMSGLYRRQLEELAGTVEIEVTASYVEDVMLRSVLAEDSRVQQLSSATRAHATPSAMLELGEAVAEDLDRRRAAEAERLLSRLSHLVVGHAERSPQPDSVLRSSFLVERSALAALDDALDTLRKETEDRLQWSVLGPLPPYNFVGSIEDS
jgi:hypothetical protein